MPPYATTVKVRSAGYPNAWRLPQPLSDRNLTGSGTDRTRSTSAIRVVGIEMDGDETIRPPILHCVIVISRSQRPDDVARRLSMARMRHLIVRYVARGSNDSASCASTAAQELKMLLIFGSVSFFAAPIAREYNLRNSAAVCTAERL